MAINENSSLIMPDAIPTTTVSLDATHADILTPQPAAAVVEHSSRRAWYLACKAILPLYVALHLAFFTISIFATLFVLPDFSTRAQPLSTLWQAWYHWDTKAYIALATHGYNSLYYAGFFPLYSLLIRGLMFLVGNPLISGLIISNIAGFIMLVVFYRLVEEDFGASHAFRSVLYISVFPAAFFFAAAYSEPLFLCLILLTFYQLRHGRWWLAGIFGFLACLTRSTGIFLLLPFLYEYLRQRNYNLKAIRVDLVSCVLLPLAIALFACYCYLHFHDLFAYSHAELIYWGRQFHYPGYGLLLSYRSIRHSPGLLSFQALRNIIDLGTNLLTALLLMLSLVGPWRLPKPLWGYSLYAIAAYLFLQFFPLANAFPLEASTRYMLEIFPAFIVLAALGKSRMLNMNYIIISGALMFLFLTQFLTGHWITG